VQRRERVADGEVLFFKNANKQYHNVMGCFKNDAAYSQLKKEKKEKRCELMYDGVVCC